MLLFVSYTLHARGGSTPTRSSSAYVCSHASAHSIAAPVHTTDTRHAEVAVACAWAGGDRDQNQTTCVQVLVVRARHRRWGGADVSLRRRVALGLSAHCVSRLRERESESAVNRERRLAGRLRACGRQHMPASTRTHVYNHDCSRRHLHLVTLRSHRARPSCRCVPCQGSAFRICARHVPVRPSLGPISLGSACVPCLTGAPAAVRAVTKIPHEQRHDELCDYYDAPAPPGKHGRQRCVRACVCGDAGARGDAARRRAPRRAAAELRAGGRGRVSYGRARPRRVAAGPRACAFAPRHWWLVVGGPYKSHGGHAHTSRPAAAPRRRRVPVPPHVRAREPLGGGGTQSPAARGAWCVAARGAVTWFRADGRRHHVVHC